MTLATGLTVPQRRAMIAIKRNGGSCSEVRVASAVMARLRSLGLLELGGPLGISHVLSVSGWRIATELDPPTIAVDPARKTCPSAHRHDQCSHTKVIRHVGGHTWARCGKEPTHALVRGDGTIYQSDCGGVDVWCEPHARDAARRSRFSFTLTVTPVEWRAP